MSNVGGCTPPSNTHRSPHWSTDQPLSRPAFCYLGTHLLHAEVGRRCHLQNTSSVDDPSTASWLWLWRSTTSQCLVEGTPPPQTAQPNVRSWLDPPFHLSPQPRRSRFGTATPPATHVVLRSPSSAAEMPRNFQKINYSRRCRPDNCRTEICRCTDNLITGRL